MKKIIFAVLALFVCIAPENYAKAGDCVQECVQVDGSLQMEIPCASYEGSNYSFRLDYYPNPDDPEGAYWKMDRGSLRKVAPDWKPTPAGDYPTYDYENGILTIPRVDTPEQAGMFQDARMELTGEGHWLLTSLKTAGTRPFYSPEIEKVELTVTETFPVQVFLKVSGFLPFSGQFLGKIPQRLKGSVFEIFMYGENLYPGDPGLPMSVTIEEVIPLSVYGLSAGTYEYSLNGGCSMSKPGAGCIPKTFTGTFVLTRDNKL